jgi:2-methylcitrate dehydratase
MPFVVAAALVDGDVNVDTYTRERFLDKDVLAMITKLKIEEDPEFTKQSPGKFNSRFKVETQDGNSFTIHRVMTLDEMREEWTDEAVEAKFRRNVRDLLAPHQVKASLDLMWHLEEVKDATQIVDQFYI